MPSRFVKQPDGRLAAFSTVVADFVALGMSPDESFCFALEREVDDCLHAVKRGLFDSAAGHGDPRVPIPGDGLNRWRDALETIGRVHRDGKARVRRAEGVAAEPYQSPEPLTEAEVAAALAAEMPCLELVRLGLPRLVAALRGVTWQK